MKLSEELKWRGFWNQTTFKNENLIDEENFTLYLGTDPSADSLHVGHLAVYMMVRRFLERGHKVVLLVGGGTGFIGDMRDTEERDLLTLKDIDKNKKALSAQVSSLFSGKNFTLVDNYDWLMDLKLLPFLRDIGKKFNMAELTSREFFKSRITAGGGLSFAEFTYTILQGYDFWHLNRELGVNLQIGGSDQWGNLLSGVELIRKKEAKEVYAMTAPLVINKSTGRKFGKSEGGAVWLDSTKTSVFKFYQFWLNSDDKGTIDYLKLFTMLEFEEIEEISQKHREEPQKRLAQKFLAREITNLVHGEKSCENVSLATEILFGGSVLSNQNNSQKLIEILEKEIPFFKAKDRKFLSDILVESANANSKNEARRLIEQNSISFQTIEENGKKVYEKINSDMILDKLILIKKGKNNFILVA